MTERRPPRDDVTSFRDRKWKEQVGIIPQYTSDPTAPLPGELWVLRSGAGPSYTYELKFRTKEKTTVKVALT